MKVRPQLGDYQLILVQFVELPSLDALNRSLSYTTPEQQMFARCELYTTKVSSITAPRGLP